jgi:hypothetical protein
MVDVLKEQVKALQELVAIRENSEVLMDTLVNLLTKVVHFCHQNNIPIEDETSINMMLRQTRTLLERLQRSNEPLISSSPTNSEQPNKTTEDGTEPNFLIKSSCF